MMNDQIKTLWEQAGGHYDGGNQHTWPQYTIDNPEKFAELIVRECAEQIIAKGTDWVDFAPSQTGVRPEYWDMAQQIKQHFGVEE
jgi:hypothetical protein